MTKRVILSECNNPIDLVFMLDSSGSINEANFKRVINFIRELAGRLDVEGGSARIAVMTFADSNTLVSANYTITSQNIYSNQTVVTDYKMATDSFLNHSLPLAALIFLCLVSYAF